MESKRAQAIKQMIKSAGLVCARMEQTAGGHIAAYLQRQDGSPIRFDFPVCFCLGELTCGIDRAWHWVALLPITEKEMTP